ncbi:MAG: DUF222 domain-containing protein [Acidimicrobiia bacterium]
MIPLLDHTEPVSVDELDEHLLLLEAARNRLDQEWTESLADFDARDGASLLEYPSTVAYLKHGMRMAASRANRYVHLARAARRFRETFESWRHNQISGDQAREMLRVAEKLPEEYERAESGLLEVCGDTPAETRKILDYWSATLDTPGVILDAEAQQARRGLDYKRKANGMLEGSFCLTTIAGEALLTGLDSLTPQDEDLRSPSQRRHDALEDLARNYLQSTDTPRVGGEKPNITVHVDLEALHGNAGGLHETTNGHVLDVETIRQLACDASITRIVFDSSSEILDVGRKTRVISPALRRAVVARDRHCVYPGCDRDATWCDVHHIVHWADGGETILANLCLLCRYHHTLIHLKEATEGTGLPELLADRRLVGAGRST